MIANNVSIKSLFIILAKMYADAEYCDIEISETQRGNKRLIIYPVTDADIKRQHKENEKKKTADPEDLSGTV